jgi:pimeloyl-ACP methyl ester carboxylesterase
LEKCPIDRVPDVPTRSILCQHDRIVAPDHSHRVAREQFGIEAVELAGSHSPMASRPQELADLLMASLPA